jgi:two-component system, OmpR family, sensor histidine kinase KdpD
MVHSAWVVRTFRLAVTAAVIAAITAMAYQSHAEKFVAGFLYLFPLMLIAFRWGFIDATVGSVIAAVCLDYFFTQPLLHFYMSDPQDWVALSCFEGLVLVTSRLADRLKAYASDTEVQRKQVEKLYRLSRELLYLNPYQGASGSLARLIGEVFSMQGVSLLDREEGHFEKWGGATLERADLNAICESANFPDAPLAGRFNRVLYRGVRAIGSLSLWTDPAERTIDARCADAIASLSAIALSRSHAHQAAFEAQTMKRNEELRSALLDGLAHAFKTPLATIASASSGILEIGLADSAQRELAGLILQESSRLSDLTNETLQTAQRESETIAPRTETVRIDALLERVKEEFDEVLGTDRLRVAGSPGQTVLADPRMLHLALAQLVENAAKYGSASAPIDLDVTESGGEIIVGVHNAGSYIPPEERPRIFRRFYRSPTAEDRTQGTGLGLAIVRRIMEAHGGRVWVESEPDTGTAVLLGLPRMKGGESSGSAGR